MVSLPSSAGVSVAVSSAAFFPSALDMIQTFRFMAHTDLSLGVSCEGESPLTLGQIKRNMLKGRNKIILFVDSELSFLARYFRPSSVVWVSMHRMARFPHGTQHRTAGVVGVMRGGNRNHSKSWNMYICILTLTLVLVK